MRLITVLLINLFLINTAYAATCSIKRGNVYNASTEFKCKVSNVGATTTEMWATGTCDNSYSAVVGIVQLREDYCRLQCAEMIIDCR